MALTDFTIVRRSLRARLFSTVITALTVAVAVALLLVILSLRDAARAAFVRGTGNAHILVSREASALESVLNSMFYRGAPQAYLLQSDLDWMLDEYPSGPRGVLAFAIPTVVGDSFRGLPVVGTTVDFLRTFEPVAAEPFRFDQGDNFGGPFEIVLGAQAARSTGLRVGQRIYLTHGLGRTSARGNDIAPPEDDHDHAHDEDEHHHHDEGGAPHMHREYAFTIVGILAPTATSHDRALFTHIEGSWVLHAHDRRVAELGDDIDLTTASELTPDDRKITGVLLRMSTISAIQQIADDIRRNGPNLRVASPAAEVQGLLRLVSNIDQLFIALAAAILISSGIGIMLALYNSMAQRRRQIAVLRVLGCSKGRIFGLVLTESAIIGLLGAAAGLALGLAGLRVASEILRARLGLVIDPGVPTVWLLSLAAATTALASLAGLLPAIMAYRTSVLRGLRPLG